MSTLEKQIKTFKVQRDKSLEHFCFFAIIHYILKASFSNKVSSVRFMIPSTNVISLTSTDPPKTPHEAYPPYFRVFD